MVLLYVEVGFARDATLIQGASGFIVPSVGHDIGSCTHSSVGVRYDHNCEIAITIYINIYSLYLMQVTGLKRL